MNFDDLKEMGKSYAKRRIWQAILAFIGPYLPVIIPVVACLLIIIMLVAAVYASMAPQRALAGVDPTPQDAKLYQQYQDLCDKYNVLDTWVVNSKMVMPDDGDKYEATPGTPFYPGKGVENIHNMADEYGSDKTIALRWGMVHAASLYWAFVKNSNDIPDKIKDSVAKDLHPYFYYKKSAKIISSKDGTTTETVYLLVEASVLDGHYQYHYRWVTKTIGTGDNAVTITYEELKDRQQIAANPYERLEDFMVKYYNISRQDIGTDRTAVYEAGKGFNNKVEWLAWLLGSSSSLTDFISGAMIPPELIPYFREAESQYGIPWWFLAAIAFKESSFNPKAENNQSGCYGLMQISPANWQEKAPLLGFDPNLDRDNPRAQIMVGAYMLYNLGVRNIDWNGNWLEQVLPALTMYAGYAGNNAQERCLREYATPVWETAMQFKSVGNARWPVPASHLIFDTYHPTGGSRAHHGVDIAAPMGSQVLSVSAGKVIYTGYDDIYGNRIDISDGVHMYRYGHLSQVLVTQGSMVAAGQNIGLVGSTGRSTGPHLHFEVHLEPDGGTIDPMLVLAQEN